jgi:sigma-B regulation protein RsbU (phosphoserine phosphatase)
MLAALWDDERRTISIANAGSVQPMVVTKCEPEPGAVAGMTDALEVQTVPVEGFPLGLFPHSTYEETVILLAPGSMVLFFSDGIPDAVNSRGEQYGTERLATLLLHHPTAAQGAQAAVDAILEAVTTHQSGTEHFDDETVIALRVR